MSAYSKIAPRLSGAQLARASLCLVMLSVAFASFAGQTSSDVTVPYDEQLVKKGRAKAQGCTRCHGRSGIAKLAERAGWEGSVAAFVTSGLVSFRDKRRTHEVMNAIASTLSDEDIHVISIWYQSVSPRTE